MEKKEKNKKISLSINLQTSPPPPPIRLLHPKERPPFALLSPSTPTSDSPSAISKDRNLKPMSTPKPAATAAATAGDVELAKSRLVAGVEPSAENSLAGASNGVGPTSSRGSRLSSLWSEMFHDAPHEMVREEGRSRGRRQSRSFFFARAFGCFERTWPVSIFFQRQIE